MKTVPVVLLSKTSSDPSSLSSAIVDGIKCLLLEAIIDFVCDALMLFEASLVAVPLLPTVPLLTSVPLLTTLLTSLSLFIAVPLLTVDLVFGMS